MNGHMKTLRMANLTMMVSDATIVGIPHMTGPKHGGGVMPRSKIHMFFFVSLQFLNENITTTLCNTH